MLYDFDYAAVTNTKLTKNDITVIYDYKTDTFNEIFLYATEFKDDAFFHSFMKNDTFKEKFVLRFLDLANTNYSYQNVEEKLFNDYRTKTTTINTFFKNRFNYIVEYLANYLNISKDMSKVSIETTKTVYLNTIEINDNFTGTYLNSFDLTLTVPTGSLQVNDINIIEQKNGVYKLRITGNNPKIIIK